MSDDDKEQLDINILSALMTHWVQDEIDGAAIAAKFDVSTQKIASLVASARRSPRAYNILMAAGAHEGQIPPWITRPGGKSGSPSGKGGAPADALIEPPVTPPGTVPHTEETPPLGREGLVPPGGPSSAPPFTTPPGFIEPTTQPPYGGSAGRLGAVYDNLRSRDQRLSELGIIRTEDGRYHQAATRPDGTPGVIEVNPAKIEQGIREDVGTKLSEAAVGEHNVHMRTVLRKIGLNPTAVHELPSGRPARETSPEVSGTFVFRLSRT